MKSLIRTTLAVALTAGFGISAFATPPGQAKNKTQNKPQLAQCPPGLQKKGCVPPGQAKKYQIGAPIYDGYIRINDPTRYNLRPAPTGHYYARVDRDIILVAEASRKVIDLVVILDALMD